MNRSIRYYCLGLLGATGMFMVPHISLAWSNQESWSNQGQYQAWSNQRHYHHRSLARKYFPTKKLEHRHRHHGYQNTASQSPAAQTESVCTFKFLVWSENTPYVAGNIVKYELNGNYYQALYNNPGYNPTISTHFWAPYTTQSCFTSAATADPSPSSAIAPSNPSVTLLSTRPIGYDKLVWSDEFDINGLPDPQKWSYDTEANATGWYNNELQYYSVARPENSVINNGKLIITARKEQMTSASDYGGQKYSSARLITRDKASWTYGFYEVRAKLSCGLGTWPAIWMLGVNGDWPAGGEIDIMEYVGKTPNTIYGTVHNQATAGTGGNGGELDVANACKDFHNYQLTWTADSLQFGVDGKIYHTYNNPRAGTNAWPFDQPQYMLLNLAIGGDMTGDVDDSIFPVTMEVDYVRIYQK
ncbi:MAG: family 16 glycosylhydrolase [Pseudomonadota bacterium]